jgi:cytochrome c556
MKKVIKLTLSIFLGFIFITPLFSSEEIIKGRKAIFSKNYKTAKAVSISIKTNDFDQAKKHLIEMSKNYKTLLNYFPEDSKTGFKTEALPTIWENSDEFIALMQKASYDVLQLAKKLDTETSNLKTLQKQLMWGNCSACHKKFRAEH